MNDSFCFSYFVLLGKGGTVYINIIEYVFKKYTIKPHK